MQRLKIAIGTPTGLVIHTDANKGLQSAISDVFGQDVEYRECFRHLLLNFNKKFRGEIFDTNMWPAAWTYVRHKHDELMDEIAQVCPAAFEHLQTFHPHKWTRSKFSPTSKIEYVCNNLAESFNSWIKDIKALPLVDLANKLRQMIMKQMSKRKEVANSLTGNILPSVVRALHAKSRGLNYTIVRSGNHGAKVTTFDKQTKKELTFGVCLDKEECSCRQWQISGKPCLHAIAFICSIRGAKIEDYIDKCFSVDKFKMAYERSITPIGDKSQVPKVDPGFKMLPPKLGRSAGRPRTTRIPNSGEGCTKKGRKRCARCHEFGHHAKGCKEPEFDPGCMVAPPPPPRAKRRKTNSSSQPPPVNDTPPSVQEPPPPVQEHATSSQPSSMDAPPPPPRAKKMTTKGPIIVGQTSQEPATSASQPIPRRTPPRQAKERAASRVAASRAQASSRKKNLLDAIINS